MASNRINRINEGIQRELADLLPGLKDPRVQGLISVTRVDTTSDLRYAKVWISVLDKATESDVIKGLKSASGYLRRELGQALQLRYTPELVFQADDSIAVGSRVLSILSQLDLPADEAEDAPEDEAD